MTILERVKECKIGYDTNHCATLLGVKNISLVDSDPYVLQGIPASNPPITHFVQIKPIVWEIRIACLDFTTFYTCFYNTDISVTAGSQYAITLATGKRTKIEYFKILAVDHAGTTVTYNVAGARVKSIELSDLTEDGKETPWIITLYAEIVSKE